MRAILISFLVFVSGCLQSGNVLMSEDAAACDAGVPVSDCVEPEPGRLVDCSFYTSWGPGGGCFCRTCPPRSDGIGLPAGTLVRGTDSSASYTVFIIGRDGRRHAFPSRVELASWYGEDSSAGPTHHWNGGEDRNHICAHVVQIPDEALTAIPLTGINVTVRPGTYIVAIDEVTTEWLVDRGAVLREVAPEVADAIFPSGGGRRIRIVPPAWFGNYTLGSPVTSAADYDRAGLAAVTLLDDLEAR